jgi:hypothetical protein
MLAFKGMVCLISLCRLANTKKVRLQFIHLHGFSCPASSGTQNPLRYGYGSSPTVERHSEDSRGSAQDSFESMSPPMQKKRALIQCHWLVLASLLYELTLYPTSFRCNPSVKNAFTASLSSLAASQILLQASTTGTPSNLPTFLTSVA